MKARLWTTAAPAATPARPRSRYVLEDEDGEPLASHGERIGVATNNVAEYRALVAGLAKAVELGVTGLEVVSDSELLVKQMRGEYRVKNDALRALNAEADRLAGKLGRVEYRHVRRAHNELADRLVNEALDAAGERGYTRRASRM